MVMNGQSRTDPAGVIICAFEPKDRAAVRQIACDTANAGQPVGTFLKDHELCADVLTSYYTDIEPGSAWVAEQNGQVEGYLTGCRNTRHFYWMMAWRIVPRAIYRAIRRGTLWDKTTRRLMWWNWDMWLPSLFQRRVPLDKYPAHLHVNLHPRLRGQHVGQQLMTRFVDQLCAAGVRGIHVAVREDNERAIRFFERQGFSRVCRYPFLRLGDNTNGMLYSIILGRALK